MANEVETDTPGASTEQASARTMGILAFSATAGVLVEFYDFFLYGYAADTTFPKLFFPGVGDTAAEVFALLTFAAGFPARVLGSFIFGHFGDRVSRKYSFLLNILITGLATVATGLLPGYATLGIAAPIILVILRVIQGIGLGGEFGGASSLLAEFGAKRRFRAFWISLSNLGIPLGAMTGSGVLLIFSDSFDTWGWRVAMLLSVVIVVPALLARYKLADSPLFDKVKRQDSLAKMPTFAVFRTHWKPIALLALVAAFQQMDGYVAGTYILSFMDKAGIALAATAGVMLIARLGDVLGIVVSGPLSEVLKRKGVAYAAVVLTTLLSIPLVLAILDQNIALTAFLLFLTMLFGVGLLHGLAPVLTAEAFPTRYRYSGAGISYNISAVLGGALAPPLLAGLIGQHATSRWYLIPVTYAIYGVVAIGSLFFVRETRDVRLEDLDR